MIGYKQNSEPFPAGVYVVPLALHIWTTTHTSRRISHSQFVNES